MLLLERMSRGLLVLALGTGVASSSYGQVRNPSFEQGITTQATSWTQFGNAFRESTGAFSGDYGLKLFGQFSGSTSVSGAYQKFKVRAGNRVYAQVRAVNRSADAVSGDNFALLKLVYFDATGNEIGASESRSMRATTQQDQSQWLSASLGSAPAETVLCGVYLLFVQPSSTPFAGGSVTFDDVTVEQGPRVQKRLVWQDEFSGTSLDSTKWEPMIGDGSLYGNPGWGNNELQYYTGRPENVEVGNGILKIIARQENFGGRGFTSARLRTQGKFDFRYGRVEARIKIPAGQGLWPAFWMLPSQSPYGGWASGGEIDIMEAVNLAEQVHGTIHYGSPWPGNLSAGGNRSKAGGYADGFHTYAIDWRPDEIRWSVDGVEYYSVNSQTWFSSVGMWNQRAPFDTSFHMLLNLAIGGNWPGSPDESTVFPAEMLVDYVRVYQDVPQSTGRR
jgi:beta-glucanase (GH16 family)